MKRTTRRLAAAATSVLLGLTAFPALPAAAETQTYYYADLDGSGALDVFDLGLMKRGLAAPDTLTDLQKAIFDTSADGQMDDADVRLLRDYLHGMIDGFPSGPIYTPPAPEASYNGQKALTSGRYVEKLDRGTYAVSTGSAVFVSWRLLAQDEPDIGFNVYRTTGGQTVKLNDSPLLGGTNFTDTTADLGKDNTYYVTTVYNGVETPTDGDFTLKAGASIFTKGNNGAAQIIPIHEGGMIHFVWLCFSHTLRLHKNTYFTAYSNAESDLNVLAVM